MPTSKKECCDEIKHHIKALACLLLLALIVFVGAKIKNEIKNEKVVKNVVQRVISVNGEGKIYAKADIAEINLGVTNEARAIAEAQNQSTTAINKIMSFLKSSGVLEKDIKTTNYSIYPVYDYIKGKQTLKGYQVSQNLDVKIRDLAKTGDIIAGAAENGANLVGSLSFTFDDPEALKAQARELAIKDAKEKAKKLASNLDIKLKGLINYSESSAGDTRVFFSEALGKGGAASAPSPEIPAGENEITINVSLAYEIR